MSVKSSYWNFLILIYNYVVWVEEHLKHVCKYRVPVCERLQNDIDILCHLYGWPKYWARFPAILILYTLLLLLAFVIDDSRLLLFEETCDCHMDIAKVSDLNNECIDCYLIKIIFSSFIEWLETAVDKQKFNFPGERQINVLMHSDKIFMLCTF